MDRNQVKKKESQYCTYQINRVDATHFEQTIIDQSFGSNIILKNDFKQDILLRLICSAAVGKTNDSISLPLCPYFIKNPLSISKQTYQYFCGNSNKETVQQLIMQNGRILSTNDFFSQIYLVGCTSYVDLQGITHTDVVDEIYPMSDMLTHNNDKMFFQLILEFEV